MEFFSDMLRFSFW